MQIRECMSRDVRIATPDDTMQTAAQAMTAIDAGFLPVGEDDRLIGIITDRDIAVRGVAAGKPPNAKVREVMTAEVNYCFDDEQTEDVLDNMSEIQVRRLPVVDRNKRLVGIISISDLAASGDTLQTGEALTDITRPSALHSQSL